MLTSAENYVTILHTFIQLTVFKYDTFFFIKNKNFVCTADLCFSCSFYFITVLFYELHFLKKLLPTRNKEPSLPEIGLPFLQTLPLQLLGFYLVLKICCN
jgi:hypothetical protein